MANPTSGARRAQHPCARDNAKPLTCFEPCTLAAKLRAQYAEAGRAPFEQRQALSRAQLAELHCPHARHGSTQVRRAHRLLRFTYGDRFREVPLDEQLGRAIGRDQNVPFVRWIEPAADERERGPKLEAYVGFSLSDHAVQANDQQATADRARVRTRAPRVREPRAAPARRPARRLELPRTPLLEQPVRIEAGALDALRATHGARGVWQVLRVLREPDCHARPAECELAVRTLAQRAAAVPGALFRTLFRAACRGDLLCDAAADRERTRAAELEGLAYADVDELRERLTAVRLGGDTEQAALLERAIADRKIACTGATGTQFPGKPALRKEDNSERPARRFPLIDPPKPEPRGGPDAGARFLAVLSPAVRATLAQRDTS